MFLQIKLKHNGASSFTLSGDAGGFQCNNYNYNKWRGAEAPKRSIRYYALNNEREQFLKDYETIVKSVYVFQSVSAWGGEDDETHNMVLLKLQSNFISGSTLTNSTKKVPKHNLKNLMLYL